MRFETPTGQQAQIDFARFIVTFTDEPGTTRVVWLFPMVLGHSRYIFDRFVMHQDQQTLLRCHMQAFAAIGGVPIEILYDRMETVVTGEGAEVRQVGAMPISGHAAARPSCCHALCTSRIMSRVPALPNVPLQMGAVGV